jgi:hypothetical protein
LKSDSQSSLSKLMSEIEHHNGDEEVIKDEMDKLHRDSGNTSVDEMMDDTPSNYNIAN